MDGIDRSRLEMVAEAISTLLTAHNGSSVLRGSVLCTKAHVEAMITYKNFSWLQKKDLKVIYDHFAPHLDVPRHFVMHQHKSEMVLRVQKDLVDKLLTIDVFPNAAKNAATKSTTNAPTNAAASSASNDPANDDYDDSDEDDDDYDDDEEDEGINLAILAAARHLQFPVPGQGVHQQPADQQSAQLPPPGAHMQPPKAPYDPNARIKAELLHTLRRQGVTTEEIQAELDAITTFTTFEEMHDNILLAIVSKRHTEEDSAMKQQEDEQLDRAILESEGERDAIQARKRKRVEDLRNCCVETLTEAEEFRRSVIIGKTLDSNGGSSYSADRNGINGHSQSSPQLKISRNSPSRNHTTAVCSPTASSGMHVHESKGLSSVLTWVDLPCKIDPCVCSKAKRELRKLIVRLLILECDSFKYHREASIPYMKKLAVRLDDASKTALAASSSSSSSPAPHTAEISDAVADALSIFLQSEINALEVGLYVMAGTRDIPDIFVEADPAMLEKANSKFDLEEDGFEVIT